MDLLHACFAFVYCKTKVANFKFKHEPVLELKVGSSIPRSRIISYLKAL